MFAPTVGVTISSPFNFPDYLGNSLYLTFGRLRSIHVNGVIFGAFSNLFIGLCYYILPRLYSAAAACGAEAGPWARRLAGAPMRWRRSVRLMSPPETMMRAPAHIQATSGLKYSRVT